jgi:predicted nucleic acid-binding protein
MIALDTSAIIAGFQLNPSPTNAVHRDRVRSYVQNQGGRILIPAIALSEYLYGFLTSERASQSAELMRQTVAIASFDTLTAEIAADLGRRFVGEKGRKQVARERGTHAACLLADLLIVATAFQHHASAILTSDPLVGDLAEFAGLPHYLLKNLPEPEPIAPVSHKPAGNRQATVFDLLDEE